MKIINGLAVVLVTVPLSCAQMSRVSMENVYGNPVVEIFKVGPNVNLTVGYGTNQQVCRLVLEPRMETTPTDTDAMAKRLHQLLDEMVPSGIRGEPKTTANIINGCAETESTDYDRAEIAETTSSKLNRRACNAQLRIVVIFKNDACDKNDLQIGPFAARPH